MKDYSYIIKLLREKYPACNIDISESYGNYKKPYHIFTITVNRFSNYEICEEFKTETELESFIKTLSI